MSPETLDCQELARRGQECYDRVLRAEVEPDHEERKLYVVTAWRV